MIIDIDQKMFCHYCHRRILNPDAFVFISPQMKRTQLKNRITLSISKEIDVAHFFCALSRGSFLTRD